MTGTEPDYRAIYEDEAVLERELRQAMRSGGEIDLFKIVRKSLHVREELTNSLVIQSILHQMWEVVAVFFDDIMEVGSLAELPQDHDIVIAHKDMQANFRAVSAINLVIQEGRQAEEQVKSADQMDDEIEEPDQ